MDDIGRTVSVSAPGKLLLMGDHAVVYGYPALVTAVDRRLHVTISQSDDQNLTVSAPDTDVEEYKKELGALGSGDIPRGARFIEAAVKRFYGAHTISQGISVTTASDFSSEFGFGSSSAVVAAVLYGLSQLFNTNTDPLSLFQLAHQTVIDVQGAGSGFDVAAAIAGGTIRYQNHPPYISSVEIGNLPFVIGYTGVKADTPEIVRQVAKKYANDREKVERIWKGIESLVIDATQRIADGEWDRVGRLMDFNQEYLRDLGVSSEKLEALIGAAKRAGAYGAKLSGAGGGDCMIAVVDEKSRTVVEDAIRNSGGTVLSAGFCAPGVMPETTDNQEEVFDIVDENDAVIGAKTRAQCHADSSLVHRTIGVLIYNSQGKLLLQKRSKTKDMDPGMWSISCAGHVSHGQGYDDAAQRELKEELGVELALTPLDTILVRQDNETERARVYKAISDGPFTLNSQEVEAVEFFSPDELNKQVADGKLELSQGARITLAHFKILE